jgi:Ca2+-transporting ATPase
VIEAPALEEVRAGAEDWHAVPVDEAFRRLESSPVGLTSAEASALLERYGPNRLVAEEREPLWRELAESLFEPLQLLLVTVGVLSFVFGEARDAVAIFVVIAAVAGIETVTELRARRALEALEELAAPAARVLRDAERVAVPVSKVVPGDVLVLEAGDVVAADGRVVEASGLLVDESALTGEAVAAAKGSLPVDLEAPPAERDSVVFAATAVVAGEGRALVFATGTKTVVGGLGEMVASEKEPPTPLERAMSELARTILVVAVLASVLVPLLGVLRGQPFRQMLLAGLTLAFATIPEELPILVSVLLAVGGRRLAKRGALLRRLRAGETVGAVTFVVTDKTGTLTENRLEPAAVDGDRDAVLSVAAATASAREGGVAGDPLEVALAAAGGQPPQGEAVATFPFDPERKLMSRVWRDGDGFVVYVKGAPEAVLAHATPGERGRWLSQVEARAGAGLRVLAFARRRLEVEPGDADEAEQDLEVVGLVSFDDPLRPGVPEAVAALRSAGVKTLVVTGDHPRTAAAVAARAGLGGGSVLLGREVAALSDDELARRIGERTVVARATPADKLRIVRVLQRTEIVAVTGDGVNDAPALAAADVGIAMGKRGTDLARAAADIVLADDAYPTIAAAVASGRTITSQLRRAVAFYLGAKVALVGVMAVPLALGLRAPFTPVQIVLLELFMDLGASVAFVAEPSAPEAMRRPPRDPRRRFLDRGEIAAIALSAAALFAGVLFAYLLVRAHYNATYGSAAAFATWLAGHALVAWALRARPLIGLRDNLAFPAWVLTAIGAGVLLSTVLARQVDLASLPHRAWSLVLIGALLSAAVAIVGRRLLAIGKL